MRGASVEVVRIGGGDPVPLGEGTPGDTAEPSQDPARPLVLVTWRDAWFDFDQALDDDERSDYLVRTVGFLVREGPRFVSIAQELLPDDDGFRAVTHIPWSVVEGIVTLDPGGTTHAAPEPLYSPSAGAEVAPDHGRRDA
jgi:hypothetical protein